MERTEQIRSPQSDPERLDLPPNTPCIYVTSIADYMEKVRHSAWIRADQPPDTMRAQVDELLAASPNLRSATPGVPGWFIEDDRGFYGLDVHLETDIDEIAAIGQGISLEGEAFGAFVAVHGAGKNALEEFIDCYQATFTDVEECIDQFLESMGWQQALNTFIAEQGLEGLVQFDRQAIWRAYAEAWEILETKEGVIHVFNR